MVGTGSPCTRHIRPLQSSSLGIGDRTHRASIAGALRLEVSPSRRHAEARAPQPKVSLDQIGAEPSNVDAASTQAATLTFRHTNRLHECLHGPRDRPSEPRCLLWPTALTDSRLGRVLASFDSQAATTVTLQSPCTHSSRRERPRSITAHGVHFLSLSNQTRNPRTIATNSEPSAPPELIPSRSASIRRTYNASAHSLRPEPHERTALLSKSVRG